MVTLRILNHTRNSVLATAASVANTPETRKLGLIPYTADEFEIGQGLFFPECNAIHTVQMQMRIDVLFIDMLKRRVQKAVQQADIGCHFNVLMPAEICSVLELPAGVIQLTGTRPGDVIAIMSSSHCSQDELNQVGRLLWPHGAA